MPSLHTTAPTRAICLALGLVLALHACSTLAACDVHGWFAAARSGNTAAVTACLNDPTFNRETPDEAGCTAIIIATLNRKKELVQHLVQAGQADVNAQCHSGQSALMYAARNGDLDIVKLLVKQGHADEFLQTNAGHVAAGVAAAQGHFHVVRYLLRAGLTTEQLASTGSWSGTALMWGAAMSDEKILRDLIGHDLDKGVNHGDAVGNTAAIWAARFGQAKNLIVLAEVGANLEAKNKYGWTALMAAALGGHVGAVAYLLNKGLDVNAVDKLGWTPTMYAALSDDTETMEALLEHFASTHQQPLAAGWNPLMVAAAAGNKKMVEFLLSRGNSPFHTTTTGQTAESLASMHGHKGVVDLLSRMRSARDLHDFHIRRSNPEHDSGDL